MQSQEPLSERKAQIMRVLWELGEATADEIRAALPDDLHDSTVRTLLRQLEKRGFAGHEVRGRTFVYRPLLEKENVRSQAISGLLRKFFGGSAKVLVQHLIRDEHLDLDEIRQLVTESGKKPRRRGKK